jgi:hypothetical protein
MKWRILFELTEASGSVRTHEMATGSRPVSGTSPETIGLTMAEGKAILATMQNQLVEAQADVYCQHRRKCAHCGSRLAIKDWRGPDVGIHLIVRNSRYFGAPAPSGGLTWHGRNGDNPPLIFC